MLQKVWCGPTRSTARTRTPSRSLKPLPYAPNLNGFFAHFVYSYSTGSTISYPSRRRAAVLADACPSGGSCLSWDLCSLDSRCCSAHAPLAHIFARARITWVPHDGFIRRRTGAVDPLGSLCGALMARRAGLRPMQTSISVEQDAPDIRASLEAMD